MVAARLLTITEFAEESREGRWELIDGEPIAVNPSSYDSARIAGNVFGHIWMWLLQHPIGQVVPSEAGFILFPDRAIVRSPDVAFVQLERLSPEFTRSFLPLAPDLAVEVLSPSDRLSDARAKVRMYLDAGIPLVWLIDPIRRTATIYQPDTSPVFLDTNGVLDGGNVLPAFTLPLATLFA